MDSPQNLTNIAAATEAPQASIFSDMVDTTPYQKHIKRARIWLYVIASLQMIMGIYEYNTIHNEKLALIAAAIDVGIGLLFLFFAFLSFKKPVAAFTSALVAYVVIHVGMMIIEPANIYKGIILKVFVVIILIRAITNAREIQTFEETIA